MNFVRLHLILIIAILTLGGCSNQNRTSPPIPTVAEERVKKTSIKLLERIKAKNYYGVKLIHYHGDIDLAIYTPESIRFTPKIDMLSMYLTRFGIDSSRIEVIDRNQKRSNEKYSFKVNYLVFDNDTAKLAINIFFMDAMGPDQISFFNYDYGPKNLGQLHLHLDSETQLVLDSLKKKKEKLR